MENQERRKFLKAAGVFSAGAIFSGCASLDRWVLGEDRENPDRVLILGGGLAGLTCAYHLKKSQIPFLLMEGSGRLGGRAFTLRDFNSASQFAELGGEWILPGHEALIRFCKELNLELIERTWGPDDVGLFRDLKWAERRKLEAELKLSFKEIQLRKTDIFGRTALRLTAFNGDEVPKAKFLDQENIQEYLKTFKFSADVQDLFALSLQTQFGAEIDKLSALSIFQLSGGTSAHFPGVDRAFRLSGGSSSLVGAIADRVAGVIPGRVIQMNSKLIEIGKAGDVFELKFQTPEGIKVKTAKTVVSALPLSVLIGIRGFENLTFPDPVMKAIEQLRYGQLAKGALSFSDRIWRRTQNISRWWSSGSQISYAEVEPRVDRPSLTMKSILSFQLGGTAGQLAGPQTLDQIAKEMIAMKFNSSTDDLGQIYNWGLAPWSRGGVSYWGPGGATKSAGVLAESGVPWIFAGEHTSLLFQGTMNGAIESALSAVRKIQQLQSKTI